QTDSNLDAEAHYNLGAALLAKGDRNGAIAALRESIRLRPREASPYFPLGNALAAAGAWDGAIPAYRDLIRLRPWDGWYSNEIYRALQRGGRHREAESIFDLPDEGDPTKDVRDDHLRRFLGALARLRAGRTDLYRQHCRDLLRRVGDVHDYVI